LRNLARWLLRQEHLRATSENVRAESTSWSLPRRRTLLHPSRAFYENQRRKFPEDPNPIREGVALLNDSKRKDIPPCARWTKIDRLLVNPEALSEAKEQFEEIMDCVIVLRVLAKEDIQKVADRTKQRRESRG
jgi:zinc finger CCCH domain-containing protein 13